ncbi:MAG: hypothetical protein JOZ22_20350 [Acidobacteriia bacterium]|nr:hypothetical protein [Terriglobia bacterium]
MRSFVSHGTTVLTILASSAISISRADVIGTAASVAGCYTTSFNQTIDTGCSEESADVHLDFTAPSQTSFSGNVSVATGSSAVETLTGSAYASAGVLKGTITSLVTSGSPPVKGILGDAYGLMLDTLTISDPLLDGEPGSLVLGMSADAKGSGAIAIDSGITTSSALWVYAGEAVPSFPIAGTSFFVPGSLSIPSYSGPAVPLIFGEPVSIELYFEAGAGAFCLNDTACQNWSAEGVSASVNASDTAVLNSLKVYDNNGALVPSTDWTITAASGLNYTPTGIVPEPSFFVPLLIVLGAFAFFTARRIPEPRL